MKIGQLHAWNLTPKEAVQLQRELAPKVDIKTKVPVKLPALVAGADISYNRFSPVLFAGVVVLRLPTFEIVEQQVLQQGVKFPYVPGLLSFREAPPILAVCKRLKARPDIVMIDGVGYAHPRRLGIASHLGLWLGIPTIGCAKSILVGDVGRLAAAAGSTAPLTHRDEIVGLAVRTKPRTKPIYVSAGSQINLDSAAAWTLAATDGYRVPEPTRQAHLLVNAARRDAAHRGVG
jgi:deoxyribonuclease V